LLSETLVHFFASRLNVAFCLFVKFQSEIREFPIEAVVRQLERPLETVPSRQARRECVFKPPDGRLDSSQLSVQTAL
jgi:hypothetical protein